MTISELRQKIEDGSYVSLPEAFKALAEAILAQAEVNHALLEAIEYVDARVTLNLRRAGGAPGEGGATTPSTPEAKLDTTVKDPWLYNQLKRKG